MTRIRIAAVTALCLLAAISVSAVAGNDADARFLSRVVERSLDGAVCKPQSRSKVIMCLVHATNGAADAMAGQIVLAAHTNDLDLSGWRITVVTLNDYVVTRRF